MTGLNCSEHDEWSEALLQVVATHLEELHLIHAGPKHLEVIHGMLCLRTLVVEVRRDYNDIRPYFDVQLPRHLEELDVLRPTRSQLHSISGLRRLRKLTLRVGESDVLDFAFPLPRLPSLSSCLEVLRVEVNGQDQTIKSVVNLVRAHASTVQELEISWHKDLPDDWDISDRLSGCDFTSLRRVALRRRHRDGDFMGRRRRCENLQKAFRGKLKLGQDVVVTCYYCDTVARRAVRLLRNLACDFPHLVQWLVRSFVVPLCFMFISVYLVGTYNTWPRKDTDTLYDVLRNGFACRDSEEYFVLLFILLYSNCPLVITK